MRASSPHAHQRLERRLPTFVGLATLICAQLGGTTAPSAQETPTRVEVMTSTECASSPGQQLLLDELRVRLSQESVVRLKQTSPADDTQGWTLRWVKPPPEDSCTLTLTDIEPVVQIPLEQDADPAAIREAIVRIAWFISTTPARSSAPKAPNAQLDPPKEPANIEAMLAAQERLAQAQEDAKTSTLDEPKPAQPSDSAKKAELAINEGSKKSSSGDGLTRQATGLADEVLATLQLWRAQTPEIFGSLDQKLQPLPSTIFGQPSALGLHLGLSTDVTLLQSKPAWLGGVHLGMFITEHLNAGLSYQSLMSDLTFTGPQTPQSIEGSAPRTRRDLSLHALALNAEYLLFPDENVHLSFAASLGAGVTSSRDLNTQAQLRRSSTFLMTTLSGNLLFDVYPWMQAGFGFSWRDIAGDDLNAVGASNFSGPSGTFLLRIGMF